MKLSYVVASLLLNAHSALPQASAPSASQPLGAQDRKTWSIYASALNVTCHKADLIDLTPGDLNLQIEHFEKKLSPAQDNSFHQAAHQACASPGSVACVNTAFLETARKSGFLEHFIDSLCHTGIRCTGPAQCTVPR